MTHVGDIMSTVGCSVQWGYQISTDRLTRLNLSASCGSRCLNRVYRHPSQLSVPEVPTRVPPQLQPYWLKI